MVRAKVQAAQRKTTLTAVIEGALRDAIDSAERTSELTDLPSKDLGLQMGDFDLNDSSSIWGFFDAERPAP